MQPFGQPLDKAALQQHIYATYNTLRFGMVVIAFAFPILLYLVGVTHGIALQDSMSAYYWAEAGCEVPARVWFVGGLFAIGSFLYLYKGFTVGENYALNAAALFVIGVAYFPMEWGCGTACAKVSAHGVCAVLMFVCLAYVAWFRSGDTLPWLGNADRETHYRGWYRVASVVMLVSPITAVLLQSVFRKSGAYVYFIELAGIWAFSLYWLIKSLEMRESQAEKRALQAPCDVEYA